MNLRLPVASAIAIASLLGGAHVAGASTAPIRVTAHHDGDSGPTTEPIRRFFTLGEPMAYVDWLCLETDRDLGASVEEELARFTVVDEAGVRLGHFTSASGARHFFRAFHVALGNGVVRHRYCTRVLPRAWREDAVRFVAERDATRTTELAFAVDGDTRCNGVACGVLEPKWAGFTYGATAARFSWAGAGFWPSTELTGGTFAVNATRFRIGAFVPLLYVAAGHPKVVRLSAQAGFAFPITLASTPSNGGSALGTAAGAYWAQCLEVRLPIAPQLCLGAEVDAAVEGVVRNGALDDVQPRLLLSWWLALGIQG
jgi:hypothetical protein